MKYVLIIFFFSFSFNLYSCEIPPSYPNLSITHDSISKWTITVGALLKIAEDGKIHFIDESVCQTRMDGVIIRGNLGSKGLGFEAGWGAGLPFMSTVALTYNFIYLPKSHSRFEKGQYHGAKLSVMGTFFSFNLAPYINNHGDSYFSAGIGMGL